MSDVDTYGNVGTVAHRCRLHARDARAEIERGARLIRDREGRLFVRLSPKAMALGEKAEALEFIAYHLEIMGLTR